MTVLYTSATVLTAFCLNLGDCTPTRKHFEEYRPAHITISGTELKAVNQFPYQECTITSDAMIDREVDNRLAKANSTFKKEYGTSLSDCLVSYPGHSLGVVLLCGGAVGVFHSPSRLGNNWFGLIRFYGTSTTIGY